MLVISAIYYIISSALNIRRDTTIFYNRYIFIILITSIIVTLTNLTYNNNQIGLFNNLFMVTTTTEIFGVFILLLTIIIINLNIFYPRKITDVYVNIKIISWLHKLINKSGEQFRIIEYPLIILFTILGALFLMSSNDIISLFLSVELQSYGLYLLCTLYRNSELSTTAGLTYFLLGSLASCFILLGTSLLYANLGVTNLNDYNIINNIYDIKYTIDNVSPENYTDYYLLIISIGFLFKISAAPFHFWSPDVYDAIPTITTTFVAIVTKISIFIFLFTIVNYATNNIFDIKWTIVLLISSFLSLIIGSVLGLNQHRIKRLFAYSTISHLGFILLALSINSIESMQAFIFYIIQYSLSNLNIFIILISLGYILYMYTEKNNNNNDNYKFLDKNNSPIQYVYQLKGFLNINIILAISLAITIYSLIGIPPMLGFFGKQIVLSSALDRGYIFITFIAILTSVISAVYYLSIIKNLFFSESDLSKNINIKNIDLLFDIQKYNICLSSNTTLPISVLTLIIVLFITNPDELLNFSNLLSIKTYT